MTRLDAIAKAAAPGKSPAYSSRQVARTDVLALVAITRAAEAVIVGWNDGALRADSEATYDLEKLADAMAALEAGDRS